MAASNGECKLVLNSNQTFSNQADLNRTLSGCTSIIGDINIDRSFTGPFSLSGITAISGGIQTAMLRPAADKEQERATPGLESVTLNDLESLESLSLAGVPALNTVWSPSLQNISVLQIFSNLPSGVNFPSLDNALEITLLGNFSSISMPVLKIVNKTLNFDNRRPLYSANFEEYVSPPSVDLLFPSLMIAQDIKVTGHLSNISMPGLETISSGVAIYANASVPLNFPSLTNISSATITGPFDSTLVFPRLSLSKGDIFLDFSATLGQPRQKTPACIEFPSLVNARSVDALGPISRLDLPLLQFLNDTLKVDSTVSFDCKTLETVANRINASYAQSNPESSRQNGPIFICEASGSENSRSRRLGLGLGLGLGLPLLLIGLLVAWKLLAKKKKKKKASKPASVDT